MKHALRSLARSPGFTSVAILTLALGIGANTAIFSTVRSVLLRPPPYPEPQRLAVLRTAHLPELNDFNASPGDFFGWRDGTQSFAALAAFAAQSFILTGDEEPQRIAGARVTADAFAVYGVAPVLGRSLTPDDDRAGAEPVAVISHSLWQQRFGQADGALGQRLRLDGRAHTIVGVMPSGFLERLHVSVWVPMAFSDAERSDSYRGARFLEVVGRLAPNATFAGAQAELDVVAGRLAARYPGFNTNWTVAVTPFADHATRHVRTTLWVLLGAVGCVLGIACLNLAGLTLARGTSRHRELVIRAALGASRSRLVRQLLMESLVIALAGGATGWLIAEWLVAALPSLAPGALLDGVEITLDARMLLFAAVLSLGTALLAGLLPAWRLSGVNLEGALKAQSGTTTSAPAHARLRRTLAVAQLAVAIALLACTGLLVHSVLRLVNVDPGFIPSDAFAVEIDLPATNYPDANSHTTFAHALLDRVRALPGVKAAGVTHALPLRGNWQIDFLLEGKPPAGDGSQKVGYFSASPDYFAAMGIRLIRGRAFADIDTAKSPPVAIVNETFAKRYFPNGDALGQRLYLMNGPWRLSEIVGIVADVKQTSLAQDAPPQAYEPFAQYPRPNLALVVRTDSRAASATPAALRRVVREVDPQQPVTAILPVEALISDNVAAQRFAALLLTAFAVVAGLLATLGVFGVMMQYVNLRTREFGLRVALGATPAQLLQSVLLQGLRLVAVGGAVGLALTAASMPLVRSLLYRAHPFDPAALAGVIVALASITLLACWIPARRATRIDPVEALRAE